MAIRDQGLGIRVDDDVGGDVGGDDAADDDGGNKFLNCRSMLVTMVAAMTI